MRSSGGVFAPNAKGIRHDKRRTGANYTTIFHNGVSYTLFTVLDAEHSLKLFEQKGVLLPESNSFSPEGHYSKVGLALRNGKFCIVKKIKKTVIDSTMPEIFWGLVQWEDEIAQHVKKIPGLLAADVTVITEDKEGKPLALLFMPLVNGSNVTALMHYITSLIKEDLLEREDVVSRITPLINHYHYEAPPIADLSKEETNWSDEDDEVTRPSICYDSPEIENMCLIKFSEEGYLLLKLQNILIINITRSLLALLQTMHGQKIFHHDIHAGNLLINWDSAELSLCDFGNSITPNCKLPPRQDIYFQCLPPEWYFMSVSERRCELNETVLFNQRFDMWQLGVMLLSCLSDSVGLYQFLIQAKPGKFGFDGQQKMPLKKTDYLAYLQGIITKELAILFINNNVPFLLQEIIKGLINPYAIKRFALAEVQERLQKLPWIAEKDMRLSLAALRHAQNPQLAAAVKNPAAFFSVRFARKSSSANVLDMGGQLKVS